jgi:hypothetical protein
MQAGFFRSEEITQTIRVPAQFSGPRSLLARVVAWTRNCADYRAAAAAYDDLSRLSDAQLNRRGLSREILARDLSNRNLGRRN